MKTTKRTDTKAGLILLMVATFALVIFPTSARAVDADLDGFDDSYEGAGKTITTIDGFTFTLDPTKKDLFVILRQATANSLLPASDPLEYISASPVLAVHQIPRNPSSASRQVSAISTQLAVRVSEDSGSTLTTGSVLGVCTYGTPNKLDEAAVYTKRIQEWIEQKSAGASSVCLGSATNCKPPGTPGWLQTIRDTYIKHTIAHEAGHMMSMTKKYSSAYGGYHYQTGSGVMMDQSVYYTNKNGVVTWYIPTKYPSAETPILK